MQANSLSQERYSLNQSITHSLFVWSSWHLINQSIITIERHLHESYALGGDTRSLIQLSDSSSSSSTTFIHSFDDDDDFAVLQLYHYHCNLWSTMTPRWPTERERESVRDRDRWCFEDETTQPSAQITLPNPVKLSPTSNWQSISQWLSLSLLNEWRAFEWHQSQSSLDETDIRDRKCSASIIIISSNSSSSSSSLSSRSSNNSVIVLVKLMQCNS